MNIQQKYEILCNFLKVNGSSWDVFEAEYYKRNLYPNMEEELTTAFNDIFIFAFPWDKTVHGIHYWEKMHRNWLALITLMNKL